MAKLLPRNSSGLPAPLLQAMIDRILQANRLLATIAYIIFEGTLIGGFAYFASNTLDTMAGIQLGWLPRNSRRYESSEDLRRTNCSTVC